ncbi:Hsp20/alpha crystallin family protein [Metabacillus sp. RGM 3146]|uniref:Hsp20/alpha crystallin family protein n=1 Tax=Metabacillus sp. RGM 3146 TaxID=3401092 RepID=UPI003B990818
MEDPFTSFWDDYAFRVDLFETSLEYIIEAELTNAPCERIRVRIENEMVIVTLLAAEDSSEGPTERSVTLPFLVNKKEVYASYENGILEIKINKDSKCFTGNTEIPIVCG